MSKARSLTAALLLFPLVLACAKEAPAKVDAAKPDSAMAGHEHMTHSGMDAPVTIPPGSIYTKADVHFMQGMIAHHAQAIFMARLAASRKANPRLIRFALKIDQSQRAEIQLMQEWLRANNQMAPDTASYHNVMMPGMLSPEQIKELEAARGPEFDRAFLVLMIQHHEGALKMVKDLFAAPGAAQDVDVSTFATDVDVVQTAEIDLMNQMLADL